MSIDARIQDYFSAFERKDKAAWLALFADDASLGGPAHTPPITGQGPLGELFTGIAGLFEKIRFEINAVHVCGPFATAEFDVHAQASNGRIGHAEGMVAFATNAEGRFTQVAGFWDPAPVFAIASSEAGTSAAVEELR